LADIKKGDEITHDYVGAGFFAIDFRRLTFVTDITFSARCEASVRNLNLAGLPPSTIGLLKNNMRLFEAQT
jgi:hypothetical protein